MPVYLFVIVYRFVTMILVFDRASASGKLGVQVKWSAPYVINSARGHTLPSEGSKELGEGYLFITNKRLFFKGANRSAAVNAACRSWKYLDPFDRRERYAIEIALTEV